MNNPPDIIQNHFAFPNGQGDEGMTLRDYFAAAAIQGLVAAQWFDPHSDPARHANAAFVIADAMLKAREQ